MRCLRFGRNEADLPLTGIIYIVLHIMINRNEGIYYVCSACICSLAVLYEYSFGCSMIDGAA